ncbi:MAG: TIGR03086 family metal-binding protein [Micromonosporaceae bacterium]
MGTDAEPLALLARALDQAGAVLAGVNESNLDARTPCPSWDVRTLANHVVHDLAHFTTAAEGGRPDYQAPIPDAGAGRVEAFRRGAAELLTAWQAAGDLDRPRQLSMGELPASFIVNQQIAELAVHAWDLARATGQPVDWDEDLARSALAWGRAALKPEFRGDEESGKSFGPEVEPAEGASAQERLVAFFGRDPAGIVA